MPMNFFEHQDVARKKTGRLVLFFALAVIITIALIYLVIAGAIAAGDGGSDLWDWRILLIVSAGVLAVVGLGSWYKISQLGAGGQVVAEMLGGRLLNHDTQDLHERKILNVVEEMAIASGTPVPPVYLLDEPGINAFAAGYSTGDAVIGVTRGCIELLSRDELQGVIAHEFSHVLNGDMKLNIRLMGIINGILVVGLIGYYTMRAGMATSRGRSSSNKKGGDPGLALAAIGVAVMVIGFIGTFFGNIIRAAVSRQREYLADASAVQFTRNPEGIAGALKKIGGHSHGSRLQHSHAKEIAHMTFAMGISGLFATHPPLPDRIARVDPQWDGSFVAAEQPVDDANEAEERRAAAVAAREAQGRERIEGFAKAAMAMSVMQMIGQPTPAHVSYAQQLIASIPQAIREAAHEVYGARALIYAMLFNTEEPARGKQEQCLAQREEPEVARLAGKLEAEVRSLDPKLRLPVIDMATGSLTRLSPPQYDRFRENVIAFIFADDQVETFEWVLSHVLLHHLDQHFKKVKRPTVQYYSLASLTQQLSVLLSTLAYVGQDERKEIEAAFNAGAAQLDVKVSLLPKEQSGLGPVDDAIEVLNTVAPPLKQKILAACAACIAADKQITIDEAELFRAIASSLDCPTPPILPGQPLV
ncbi:MAG: M48 family metallopeptidase [Phycisphaeraceae bacterium]